ncbi:hypothetical protein PF010_g28768 [Phytophthora fragariae]|uniref:Uncharacterized protein n=1 Tax=Phytophthora fragariae TaxID=53985 RepID=A0A6A3HA24_9STRA|nr:hypothetical protein PF003_g36136 [Phytophthora fragariae]KAE8920176.1 hypothetical protein PF009_g29528 [Phytophthora fragariae]KAE8966027.1 hypothetical protein PF011_g28083 [Phytophthora fragariae]KAE9064046.1 hypothetical protein PF010_g28768 [Phytophthora fragariae]KAE9074440.1 hypothetical protein PF006_g28546 [Phytophthora fragariae]
MSGTDSPICSDSSAAKVVPSVTICVLPDIVHKSKYAIPGSF